MTFISDQLVYLDAQLDRLQLDRLSPSDTAKPGHVSHFPEPTAHARNLQNIIKALSVTPGPPLPPQRIVSLLQSANFNKQLGFQEGYKDEDGEMDNAGTDGREVSGRKHYPYELELELELEWVLLCKATIQTYGVVLNSLVEQTLPLAQDMFYWDEVFSSHAYTALYSIQTSPQRVVRFSKEVFADAMRRLRELREMERIPVLPGRYRISQESLELKEGEDHDTWLEAPSKSDTFSQNVRKFYVLVKNSLHERSFRMAAMSPLSLARHEIREKQASIKKLREMKASALGALIEEGLSFGFEKGYDEYIIEKAVLLLENVVRNVSSVNYTLDEFEEIIFRLDKSEEGGVKSSQSRNTRAKTADLAKQLQDILMKHLPAQIAASKALIATHGRPGLLTRYWFPATALLLSSTTILRILVNRQAELKDWIQDLGSTIIDFWMNSIVEPARKVIGTIRHSEDTEVALMSRNSLQADMESLERMVVDFAVDNPAAVSSTNDTSTLSEAQIEAVRLRVKEGDLTPVLKVYEHDLRNPFKGAIMGELVRALLVQIQKTKVDVEVAISGIDRLLKSQELVFGFLGLTPGVLVCVGVVQWARSTMGGRKGRRSYNRAGQMVRTLRNVDRILTGSQATRGGGSGILTYKEHGLLLCEVHVLRELAREVLPGGVGGEFVEDVEELVDVSRGAVNQLRVVERIRWAYARWIK